jgi:hypothetical protein
VPRLVLRQMCRMMMLPIIKKVSLSLQSKLAESQAAPAAAEGQPAHAAA